MTTTALSSGTFEIRPTLAGRAKAFGLAVLYLAVFAALLAALVFGLAATGLVPAVRAEHLMQTQQFLREGADAAAAVLAVAGFALLTREPMSRWGFATGGAPRDFPTGLAAGFVLMSAVLLAMAALGGFQFGPIALGPDRIPGAAALFALFSLSVAVFEETLFRSFVLVQLSRAFGFWPAAVVTALLFGLAHSGNPGEAPFGLVVAGLGGLVFAYAFRRTGALWFSIGFHAAWAYAEDFVFGVPDSGNVQPGVLLHPLIHGPDWLTGGKVGPEGSLLALAAIVAAALIGRFALPRRTAGG